MAFKILRLECLTEWPNNDIIARIQRHDGLHYDFITKTFKTTVSNTNSFIKLISGEGITQNISSAEVQLDPVQFTDGDYSLYYHDSLNLVNGIPKIFGSDQVTIFRGSPMSQFVPNTTDIALRLFTVSVGSHKTPGSYGAAINSLLADVKAIKTKLGI